MSLCLVYLFTLINVIIKMFCLKWEFTIVDLHQIIRSILINISPVDNSGLTPGGRDTQIAYKTSAVTKKQIAAPPMLSFLCFAKKDPFEKEPRKESPRFFSWSLKNQHMKKLS